jgi:hypothetical protein
VKENVDATVIRFDEAKPFIPVEHLDFAGWHAVLKDFSYGVSLERACAVNKDGPKTPLVRFGSGSWSTPATA